MRHVPQMLAKINSCCEFHRVACIYITIGNQLVGLIADDWGAKTTASIRPTHPYIHIALQIGHPL